MSEKRKDSKGRVLKDGESQRANGTYDYRYTDIHKKRRCIYAKSLTELRKKEDELRRDMADGIDYAAGDMTVAELVDRYMNLKRGLKQNSLRSYGSAVKRIHADPFGQNPIKTVKLSDAKGWFVFLHDSGISKTPSACCKALSDRHLKWRWMMTSSARTRSSSSCLTWCQKTPIYAMR